MATPSSGLIRIGMIRNELGLTGPLGLGQLYRGGSLVPNTAPYMSIPTSGAISLTHFYNFTKPSAAGMVVTANDIYEHIPSSSGNPGTLYMEAFSTASVMDSSGTVTYNWTRVSGTTAINIQGASNTASVIFGANVPINGSATGVWRVTATDANGPKTHDITVEFYYGILT